MRCSIVGCPGEYEQREVVRAIRQGSRIIVIEDIPAEVCNGRAISQIATAQKRKDAHIQATRSS